jgi:hypothetical protein
MGRARASWPVAAAVASFATIACGREDDGGGAGGGDVSSGGSGIVLDEGGEKLDVGDGMSTAGPGDCMGSGGGGQNTYSIIWIANSPEGTVSKIDTTSGVELARYYTGPTDGGDDPSRTSVNLTGDVAVSNRGSGIAKFASEEIRCMDTNGNGTIDTSTGPGDVRPFGEDECLLWHVPTPSDGNNHHGPRPTAWDAGAGGNPCDVGDDRLWIGWWAFDDNIGRFQRLDGANGALLDEVDVVDWDTVGDTDYGPYGGAVNAEGDLWTVGRSPGPLVRIDGETLQYERWDVPEGESPYGIAVDATGDPWMGDWNGGLLHFDADTEQFTVIDTPNSSRARGLMVDRDGYLWAAGNDPCSAIQLDVSTKTLVSDTIPLPGCDDPVGVSIDAEGYVWLPDRGAGLAFKLHPVDYSTQTTTGLVGPYTYSDMTGAGLGLVVDPPAG